MCGRFALALPADEIQQLPGYPALQHQVGEWVNQDRFVPRYNIAPRSQAPVIRRRNAASGSSEREEEPALILHTMKWGLVPHWSKSEGGDLKTINARGENLVEGAGLWGSIKGKRRCVVPAQGYYEWTKKGKERVPHFIRHKDGKLMLLAGLYDIAHIEGQSEPLWTFTIVTTAANKEQEWLHDRQPVILVDQAAIDAWLDTSSQTWSKSLSRLLDPYDESQSPLECYTVPKEVGKVGTESPTFIQPISKRKDGIEAMFSKQKKQGDMPKSEKTTVDSAPGTKRKRSLSVSSVPEKRDFEIVSIGVGVGEGATKEEGLPGRQSKEEDSDIETISGSSPGPQSKSSKKSARKDSDTTPSGSQTQRPAKKAKPSKATSPKKGDGDSTSKITSFFSKT